jgi:hypothetical protein
VSNPGGANACAPAKRERTKKNKQEERTDFMAWLVPAQNYFEAGAAAINALILVAAA